MAVAKAAPRRGDPPASIAAEQALIGCVLLDEWQVWGEVEDVPVEAEDFFQPEHQAIWRAFRWLYDHGTPVTGISTTHALEQIGVLDAVDSWLGPPWTEPYLAQLEGETWSATGCSAFARMVKHYSAMRAPVAIPSRRVMSL